MKIYKSDWITDYITALKWLKYTLLHAPILEMPSFDANFVAETNATDMVVGKDFMPVAFISKALNSVKWNYHAIDHKLLAILLAWKGWHPYLNGQKTAVLAD